MYSRASLSRTVTLVVALSLTAVSTGVIARAFGAADLTSAIDLDRRNDAAAISGIHAQAQPDAAPARMIELIRKVE